MFFNRKNELETLNKDYNHKMATFSVIYGRRRVGKTALISEFIKDKPNVYFYATSSDLKQQYTHLSKIVLRLLNPKHAEHIKLDDFESIINFIVEEKWDQKLVFVIDEFQNLCYLDKSFSSKLQQLWDTVLSKTNIHLIICGSVLSMMYSEVLNETAPLYGRRTSNIALKPMHFKHIKDFLPNVTRLDQMKIFASFSTIPKYLQTYNKSLEFEENIKQNILNKDSYLYAEGQFLLNMGIMDIGTYFGIIEAISKGNTKVGHIASVLGVHSSYLSNYLQRLIELDILIKEVPVTENDPRKSKMGRYRIKDKFLNFWFNYVYKNYQYLELGQIEAVLKEIEMNFNDKFVSVAFEDYIQELILLDPEKYIGFRPLKVGRWWSNNEEIDLIAYNDTDMAFIECKWTEINNKEKVINKLIQKATNVEHEDRKLHYLVFTKNDYLNEQE